MAVGLALAWGATLAGRLRANPRHTYGWRRASILAAVAAWLRARPVVTELHDLHV